ncbi:aldo/keto reductase [Chitinophaga filiformis]|uniref:Predicted oxidoreductase n=1 Tax=Chitinophaga filiformis TaxID=104663 RepID=A0A1G7S8Q6_CHIFI|nr:aldo/keto reductase [Chitinophaga filiformis]SDG19312.1 Predicted oxidoreductase [Chitinophaga filiformis]
MKYSKLGNTGLVVSRLSFGTMTFGNDPSITAVYKVTQEDAQIMVDKALDAGINFFDTADGYSAGQSEVMLGKALAKRRQDVVIATKVGFRTGEPVTQAGLSRRHILFSCEQSLKRLNTDYIDLYIVHKEDPYTPLEETLETLDMLVRAGKVRYIGFSNWTVWKAAIAYQMQKERGWATFCNGQMYYSLLGRDVEYDIVPFMQHAGIGMTIWSPLAGGFLSGKYTREGAKDQDNRLSGFDILPFDKEKGYDVVDVLKEIAATHSASPAQVALSWLLAKPVVSSILVGASKLHQLENNLKAVEVELSDTEIKTLDDLTQPGVSYPHWFVQNLADQKHKEILGTK